MKLVKRYIVRLVADPIWIEQPVIDLRIADEAQLHREWFISQEVAEKEILKYGREVGVDMCYVIIPIYIRTEESVDEEDH